MGLNQAEKEVNAMKKDRIFYSSMAQLINANTSKTDFDYRSAVKNVVFVFKSGIKNKSNNLE